MHLQAKAKINWALEITGTRADGYHLLDGVMQSLALCDELDIFPADTLSLSVDGAPLSQGEDNLVLKAAKALQQHTGCMPGAHIRLQKHIPMGAGLGGGSADCAAALKGLNDLWQLGLSTKTLLDIGVKLGADVPFCTLGTPMRAQGIGEILSPVPCKRTFPLVLLQPCEGLSTKEIFAAYHAENPKGGNVDMVIKALENGDLALMEQSSVNMLEAVSVKKKPELQQAKDALYRCSAAFARMTGSGSVVFGAFETAQQAKEAYNTLSALYQTCILTETTA